VKTVKPGDVNHDGLIDGADASMILYANANGIEENLTPEEREAADINQDDLIDGVDASMLLIYNVYTANNGELSLTDWIRIMFSSK
jgi:hypothetical protein